MYKASQVLRSSNFIVSIIIVGIAVTGVIAVSSCVALKGKGAYGNTILDTVPMDDVTHTAIHSGNWSEAQTWGTASDDIPDEGANIYIPIGVTVNVDGIIPTRISSIRLEGTLRFLPSVDTELQVETIIATADSLLEIGTEQTPISADFTARIIFIDEGSIASDRFRGRDYEQYSKGLVTMGKTIVHGSPKSSWHAIQTLSLTDSSIASAKIPQKGSSAIVLEEIPTAWEIGDIIVITGTAHDNPETDEKRIISAINENEITLNRPLERDHIPPHESLRVHSANLTRNVIFMSENPDIEHRGHVMFMHTLGVDIRYARFYQLGRTNKRQQLDDWYFPTLEADKFKAGKRKNIRGRYSLHIHRGGVFPDTSPAVIQGNVVEDDPGWAYVNHSSHVDFIENVSYNVVGGGFQTEAGDEIGSFRRNIAIRTVNPDFPALNPDTEDVDTRERSQDFAFQGDGFWFHGGGVYIVGNVASGSSGHGFIFWTEGLREVNTSYTLQNMFDVNNVPNGDLISEVDYVQSWWVPIQEFKNNTTYSSSKGFATYYIHATLFEDIDNMSKAYLDTVHTNYEDFTIWNVKKYGIEIHNSERFTYKNLRMYNDGDSNTIGILNHVTVARESNWENIHVEGFGIGMIPAMQGNVRIHEGVFSNRWDFRILPPQRDSRVPGWDRDMKIDGVVFEQSKYFPASDIIHFKMEGGSTLFSQMSEEEPFPEAEFQNKFFLIPDRIVVNIAEISEMRLYYDEQESDYVPITEDNIFDARRSYREDIMGKSNQELMEELHLAFAGGLLPADAQRHPFVVGGKISPTDIALSVPACHFIGEPLKEANAYDDFNFYDCWEEEE